ncbi:MAG TPA: histidine phosphatase family protein [Mycobacteriales bacterium]|jgi:probable phosphoglycerate mutase
MTGAYTSGAGSDPGPALAVVPVPRGIVVLVRHGETEWSAAGRHTGRTDVPLTPTGERQAGALGTLLERMLAGRRVVLTLTSPLRRARRTAELAGLHAECEPALHELEYGDHEGRTTAAIRAGGKPGWTVWTGEMPHGETPDLATPRVDAVIDRVCEALSAAPDEDPPPAVVLVGHGHHLRILGARWLGLPASAGALFGLGTASVSVLGTEHETPVLVHWNLSTDLLTPDGDAAP